MAYVTDVVSKPTESRRDRSSCPLQSRTLVFFALATICLLLFGSQTNAQDLTVRLSLINLSQQPAVRVEGVYAKGSSRWQFPNTYGRVMNLGDRIQNLRFAAGSAPIASQRTGPAEFKTSRAAVEFVYEVNLAGPSNPDDAAHVSWLNQQHGYLMLADLLPDFPTSTMQIELSLPSDWTVASSAIRNSQGRYDINDKAKTIFFVGRDLKQKHKRLGASEFTFVAAGEWSISSGAVVEKAARIMKDRTRNTGFEPKGQITLMLAPFPGTATAQGWSAETRGNNVVMVANSSPAAKFSSAQLSVVLCHELFHLWVPNALSLGGDYAWFYEGFTLYQALCTAVRLRLVDFREYLATLGRVYDSYRSASEGNNQSLLAASEHRWTSGGSLVYDQGMLVAFLCDLKLRKAAREGLDVVYRKLMRDFSSGSEQLDGNEAIIKVLAEQVGDEQFVRRYIESPSKIELEALLPDFGMQIVNSGNQKRLEIIAPLTSEQSELLAGLGYRKASH